MFSLPPFPPSPSLSACRALTPSRRRPDEMPDEPALLFSPPTLSSPMTTPGATGGGSSNVDMALPGAEAAPSTDASAAAGFSACSTSTARAAATTRRACGRRSARRRCDLRVFCVLCVGWGARCVHCCGRFHRCACAAAVRCAPLRCATKRSITLGPLHPAITPCRLCKLCNTITACIVPTHPTKAAGSGTSAALLLLLPTAAAAPTAARRGVAADAALPPPRTSLDAPSML